MMMYMEARMGDVMVRKQIYLPRQQNQLVKRLAKQRGVSEAEVIRQALKREAEMSAPVVRDSKRALDEIIAFARSLREHSELMQGEPIRWNRQELYEERESRWFEKDEGG
ncbi:MAG: hypothetical protein CO064_11930 [Anaerolineae bacterium CG_4_9_14_0_8_um_filter_58_9]|nr:MAG: hypothetical protein CO064_11930 [Anaerolineae bacterium CG_4_9_14_0_8_um_filter_58_9]